MSARLWPHCLATLTLAAGCIAHPVGTDPEFDPESDAGADTPAAADPGSPRAGPATDAPTPPTPFEIGGDDHQVPPPSEGEGPPEEPAEGSTAPTPPPASPPDCTLRPYVVHRPESATRVGAALYLALHDGRVVRAPMADGVLGWPADVPELSGIEGDTGLAAFREIQPGVLARVVRRGDAALVGLLTLGPNAVATLRSEVAIGQANPGADAFAIAEGRLHLCAAGRLVTIDATDPSAPVETRGPGEICATGEAITGGGRFLGRIRHGRGALVPSYAVVETSAAGGRTLVDHGFNPSGVHRYGDIVAMHLGETRGIVDVRHPSNFFGLDLVGETGSHIYDTSLDIGLRATLISAAHDHAWLTFQRDVMAYDLWAPGQPRLHPHVFRHTWDDALAAERAEIPRILYADEAVVAIRGQDGLLSVHDFQRGTRRPLAYDPCETVTAFR